MTRRIATIACVCRPGTGIRHLHGGREDLLGERDQITAMIKKLLARVFFPPKEINDCSFAMSSLSSNFSHFSGSREHYPLRFPQTG